MRKIHKRNYFKKKKAAGKNNIARWEQYKQAQNSPSIEIGDEG